MTVRQGGLGFGVNVDGVRRRRGIDGFQRSYTDGVMITSDEAIDIVGFGVLVMRASTNDDEDDSSIG